MKRFLFAAVAVIYMAVSTACGNDTVNGGEGGGEHAEGDEESGTQLALSETYDEVRNGARLILAYDEQSNSFIGTVVNTTDTTLQQVRVEVHLSNGIELGPTTPADLGPDEQSDVSLTATEASFDSWSAHPESGESDSGEHSSSGNG